MGISAGCLNRFKNYFFQDVQFNNSLDNSVRDIRNFSSFKKILKTHSNSVCSFISSFMNVKSQDF